MEVGLPLRPLIHHVTKGKDCARSQKCALGEKKSQDKRKLAVFRNSWVMLGEQVVNKYIIDQFGKLGEDLLKVH